MSPLSRSHARAADNPPFETQRTQGPIPLHLGFTGRYGETLSPPGPHRGGMRPYRPLRWLPRPTWNATVVACLVVLLGALTTSTAAAPAVIAVTHTTLTEPSPTADPCAPDSALTVCPPAAPATTSPLDNPAIPGSCLPGSSPMGCQNPANTATSSSLPCTGLGCLPQAVTSVPGLAGASTGQPGEGDTGQVGCGLTSLGGCVTNAITAFFRSLVAAALNPLLELLSKTLLTTPTPDSVPRIGELWTNSWQILLACYAVLVLIAGLVVMAYQSLQTHYSIKEIAPRIVIGFLAGAMSLGMASTAIQIANALAQAVLGEGLDAASTGKTLRNLVLGSINGGIFVLLIGVFVAGMLLVLLVTYLVRVALTVILVAGAPLALMFHALPQTEGIARWWWKAFGGCLAIQVVQSLTLITAMKVFLAPGGFTPFGPTTSGLVNLLVALALFYILIKIPFWILGSLRIGGGRRSVVGTVARAYVIGNALGWIRGGPQPSTVGPGSPGTGGPHPRPGGGGPSGGPRGSGPRGGGPRGGPSLSPRHPFPGGPSGSGGPSSGGGAARQPGHASPCGQTRPPSLFADPTATPAAPSQLIPLTSAASTRQRHPSAALPGVTRAASPHRPGLRTAGLPPAASAWPPPPTLRVAPPRLIANAPPAPRPGPAQQSILGRPPRSRSGGMW